MRNSVNQESEKPRRTVRRRWRIVLVTLVLIVSAAALFYAIRTRHVQETPAVERFSSYLNNDNIKAARSLYYEQIYGDTEQEAEVQTLVVEQLHEIGDDYAAGKRSYENCLTIISALRETNILIPEQEFVKLHQQLDAMLVSKQAYSRGQMAMTERAWPEAIEALSEVVEGDIYSNNAQESLSEATETWVEELTTEADVLAGNGNYAGAAELLAAGLDVLPDSIELSGAFADIRTRTDTRYRDAIQARVDDLMETEDVAAALNLLDEAGRYLNQLKRLDPDELTGHPMRQANLNADLQAVQLQRGRIRSEVLQMLSGVIDEAIQSGIYKEAIGDLEFAITAFPDDEAVIAERIRLQQSMHLSIFDWLLSQPAKEHEAWLTETLLSGGQVYSESLLLFPRTETILIEPEATSAAADDEQTGQTDAEAPGEAEAGEGETEAETTRPAEPQPIDILLPYRGEGEAWQIELPAVPLAYNELTITFHLPDVTTSRVSAEIELEHDGTTWTSQPLTAGEKQYRRMSVSEGEPLTITIHFLIDGEPVAAETAWYEGLVVLMTGSLAHDGEVEFVPGAAATADPPGLLEEEQGSPTSEQRVPT